MSDYEAEYAEWWKGIIENPDGTLNLDQVKRELSDYSAMADQVSRVYDDLTNGQISKPNTLASAVIAEVEERFQKLADNNLVEMVKQVIQVFEDCDEDAEPDELREAVLEALNVTDI